jgi:hypothetical protein
MLNVADYSNQWVYFDYTLDMGCFSKQQEYFCSPKIGFKIIPCRVFVTASLQYPPPHPHAHIHPVCCGNGKSQCKFTTSAYKFCPPSVCPQGALATLCP